MQKTINPPVTRDGLIIYINWLLQAYVIPIK